MIHVLFVVIIYPTAAEQQERSFGSLRDKREDT
jgi:hypothetical protein